eukprot:985852-Pelagomonas_calceolata.AAC.1
MDFVPRREELRRQSNNPTFIEGGKPYDPMPQFKQRAEKENRSSNEKESKMKAEKLLCQTLNSKQIQAHWQSACHLRSPFGKPCLAAYC